MIRLYGRSRRNRMGMMVNLWTLLTILAWSCASASRAQSDGGEPAPTLNESSPLERASRLIAAEDFAQAEVNLRAYLAANPTSADGDFLLAYTLLRENKPTESLAEYTRAAKLRTPTSVDLKNVALDYSLIESWEDAQRWISESLKMNPGDAEAWYVFGRILYEQKYYIKAVKCYRKALVLAPKNVKTENNLGLAYVELNRTDDAIAAYRQAIQWQTGASKPSEQPLLNLAIVLMQNDASLKEASQLLADAAAIAPQDPKIHEKLGQVYLQQDYADKAQQEFQTAVKLTPKNGSLHFLLGQAYRREGKQDEAKAEFALAASLIGTHSTSNRP